MGKYFLYEWVNYLDYWDIGGDEVAIEEEGIKAPGEWMDIEFILVLWCDSG